MTKPTKVLPIGPAEHGALPVRIIFDDGSLSEEIFYWHQPERRK